MLVEDGLPEYPGPLKVLVDGDAGGVDVAIYCACTRCKRLKLGFISLDVAVAYKYTIKKWSYIGVIPEAKRPTAGSFTEDLL